MSIPFIDLKSQYAQLKQDVDRRIHAVLDHGRYIMGPEVFELEERLAAFCGVKHAVTLANGTDALQVALMTQGVGPGDAVFTPAFTFTATAEAVLILGAEPVFVDVNPDTFNIDSEDLAQKIKAVRAEGRLTPKGVITVDLFGQPADYAAITSLAKTAGLFVLGDAAQSFGAALNEVPVGRLADITTTSFFPAKPLGCYGDGGALLTDNDDVARMARSIREHGKGDTKYDIDRIGLNSRLDTIQAAVLLAKLEVFEAEVERRNHIASVYSAELNDCVKTPFVMHGARSVWAQYTLQCQQRNELAAYLADEGVPTAVYYPRPMHLQKAYVAFGDGENTLPVSEQLSHDVLSLPMHPYLQDEEIARLCRFVRAFLTA